MKKHSCGAILYTIFNNKLYVILGMEKGKWYPFKGTRELGETNEIAAIREIYEETCGIIKVKNIDLLCNFTTKRKHYHIGVVKIDHDFIKKFYNTRKYILKNTNHSCINYNSFLEKNAIKMFSLESIRYKKFHYVTETPINYFYEYLNEIEKKSYINKTKELCVKIPTLNI
jgi:DNA-binding ferritin-like protein (Dps family)